MTSVENNTTNECPPGEYKMETQNGGLSPCQTETEHFWRRFWFPLVGLPVTFFGCIFFLWIHGRCKKRWPAWCDEDAAAGVAATATPAVTAENDAGSDAGSDAGDRDAGL